MSTFKKCMLATVFAFSSFGVWAQNTHDHQSNPSSSTTTPPVSASTDSSSTAPAMNQMMEQHMKMMHDQGGKQGGGMMGGGMMGGGMMSGGMECMQAMNQRMDKMESMMKTMMDRMPVPTPR